MKKALILLLIASTILSILIFLPYSLRISHSLPNAVDPVFYAWNLSHNTESALHGFKNLLDTNIFYPEGNTLAFSDTLFAQTLFTAPVLTLTNNPVLAENLYIFATFPLAAITMFLLSYYLTGHALASAFAGIFYAFSYPRLSQIGHVPAVSSQWLPLYFLYLIKFVRDGKFINLFLLFVWYVLSIASSMYFGVYILPLSLITVAVEIVRQSRNALLMRIKTIFIFTIPAIIILGIIVYPYIRLKAEYPNVGRALTNVIDYSATLADYVSVLPTSWLGDIGVRITTNEHPLYPTATVLILALISAWFAVKNRNKTVLGFLGIAVAALFLSMGPYWNMTDVRLPYYYLYQVYPLLESVRVPARFSIYVILGLSVGAAYALSIIFKYAKYHFVSIIVLLVFLTEVWQVGTPSVSIPLKHNLPPVYTFLIEKPDDAIIVELPLRLESEGLTMADQLFKPYAIVTEMDTYALEAYRTYFSAFHGKRTMNGYSGFFPNVYHDHIKSLSTFPSQESLAMLKKAHVRYILIHASQYVSLRFSDVERQIRESQRLTKVAQFGDDYVYEL